MFDFGSLFSSFASGVKGASSMQHLMVGLNAVQSLTQHSQQADAYSRTSAALDESLRNTLTAFDERKGEVNDKATQEKMERAKQAAKDSASQRLASGENAIGGPLAARLLRDIQFDAGHDVSMIEANRKSENKQIEREKSGARLKTQSEKNRLHKPSGLNTFLGIANSGLQIYSKTPKKSKEG